MRDHSFTLQPALGAAPPFAYEPMYWRPWAWAVTDARGVTIAAARTRAGARAAVRALYAGLTAAGRG